MVSFRIRLQPTYYGKGFFNVPVDHERYIRVSDGPIRLQLGDDGPILDGRTSRSANNTGVPRVFGGTTLRDFFHRHFRESQEITIDVAGPDHLIFRVPAGVETVPPERNSGRAVRPPVPVVRPKPGVREPQAIAVVPEATDDLPDTPVSSAISGFMTRLARGELEVYNEFSLQHELGIHLRTALPDRKVQFERNVSHFGFAKAGFEKKEIDIVVLNAATGRQEAAIEIKNPRNGQIPEAMYSFCKDIVFLEQLCDAGFREGHFLALVDDPAFYSGKTAGIYGHFRGEVPIAGEIRKPTGNSQESLSICGRHVARWESLKDAERYCHIRIHRTDRF